jgi:hypothetical protein
MSTRTLTRRRATRTAQPLTEPPVIEGDCPACRGTYPVQTVTVAGVGPVSQVPEHIRADRWTKRRCPCSGWLARNPRRASFFYREGVMFL